MFLAFDAFKRRSLQPRVFNNNFVHGSIVVVVRFADKVKWDVIDLAAIYFCQAFFMFSNVQFRRGLPCRLLLRGFLIRSGVALVASAGVVNDTW